MSENENHQVVLARQVQPTKFARVKEHLGKVALVTASFVLPALAHAEGEGGISGIGAGLTSEIDASKGIVLTLFGAGAVILGMFAGYRYLKRGANSA